MIPSLGKSLLFQALTQFCDPRWFETLWEALHGDSGCLFSGVKDMSLASLVFRQSSVLAHLLPGMFLSADL